MSSNKFYYKGPVDLWVDRWASSIDEVKSHFRRYNLLDDNVLFLKVDVANSLKVTPYEKLALVRIDVDSYESYMETLISVYPKMANGGCIIFDDWHLSSCRDAINDFRIQNNISLEICETFIGKKVDAYWIL